MSRLFTNGFENAGALDWTSTTGSPVIQSTIVRGGSKAGQITSLASGVTQAWVYQFSPSDISTDTYVRFYLYVAAYPNVTTPIAALYNSLPNDSADVRLTATGTVFMVDNTGSQVGAASSALALNTWHRVEFRYFPTSTTLGLVVNGVSVMTSTTGTTDTIRELRIGGNIAGATATSGTWYFDDIAINNTTTTTNNSYPGELPAVLIHRFNNSGLRPHPFSPGLAR